MSSALTPPLSKSDAQRALVLADLLGVPFSDVLPSDEALPRDVEVLRAGLLALRHRSARIDCHDGGAPFRFLLGQAAVLPSREVEFTGTERLAERPHAPLRSALTRALPGLSLDGEGWPLKLKTSASPPTEVQFVVDASLSSQFASSLLLAAARVVKQGGRASLCFEGEPMTSEGYFALTRRWLSRGFTLDTRSDGALVLSLASHAPQPVVIPGDWSSLGYLLALSWVADLPVARMEFGTGHPDEHFVTAVRDAGLQVTVDRLVGNAHRGLEVDASACPDSIPVLAALATRLPSPSRFINASVLRHKESDRLAGLVDLLTAAGLRAELSSTSTLTVFPGNVSTSFAFDERGDHRLAMSAAVLARLHGHAVTLNDRGCVAKSFPNFWTEAAKAGVP